MMVTTAVVALGMMMGQGVKSPDTFQAIKAFKTIPASVRNSFLESEKMIPDASGNTGSNKDEDWRVNDQRLLGMRLMYAIADGNKASATRELDAIEKTFAKIKSDGSFEASMKGQQAIGNLVNSNLSLLSETVPALMQLRAWDSTFGARVEGLKPEIQKAASFAYPHRDTVIARAGNSANWVFRDARTWMQLGNYLGNSSYTSAGESLLRKALSMQRPDGVFVEEGGADTTYHAVSLRHLAFIVYMDPSSTNKTALRKGGDWYISRFREDGRIDVRGNTRTAIGKTSGRGGNKVGNSPDTAVMTLQLLADIFPDSGAAAAAQRHMKAAYNGERMRNRDKYIYYGD